MRIAGTETGDAKLKLLRGSRTAGGRIAGCCCRYRSRVPGKDFGPRIEILGGFGRASAALVSTRLAIHDPSSCDAAEPSLQAGGALPKPSRPSGI